MPNIIYQTHELQDLDTALGHAVQARTQAEHQQSFNAGYVAGCAVGQQQERLHWHLHLQGYLAQLARFDETMAARVPFSPRIDAPKRLRNEDLDYLRGAAS